MASKTTKISSDTNMHSSEPASCMEDRVQAMSNTAQKGNGIDWKWVAVGGTVALVLGLHTSAVGRALLLGAGHRIARR